MNQPITFTAQDVVSIIMYISGAIVSISAAGAVIARAWARLRKPTQTQDEILADHERRLTKHDELLNRDYNRLEALEEGNRITQQALLALMAHAIDGNSTESLKKAKEDLTFYLINKR